MLSDFNSELPRCACRPASKTCCTSWLSSRSAPAHHELRVDGRFVRPATQPSPATPLCCFLWQSKRQWKKMLRACSGTTPPLQQSLQWNSCSLGMAAAVRGTCCPCPEFSSTSPRSAISSVSVKLRPNSLVEPIPLPTFTHVPCPSRRNRKFFLKLHFIGPLLVSDSLNWIPSSRE